MQNTVHEQVMKSMKDIAEQFARSGIALLMPPPSNTTLGTTYTAMEHAKSLSAEIRFDERFCNPLRVLQGGFLCAVFDEVFGPLAYMAAKRPVVTIEMSRTFIRRFTEKDQVLSVRADLVARSRSVLVLRAEAQCRSGRLIATSSSHSLILSDSQLEGAK
jgi:acyl-coenzyme A thioesterase PaaI-like protein